MIATGLAVVAPAMDIAGTRRMLLLLPTPLMILGAAFTAPHEKPGARRLWGVLALPLGPAGRPPFTRSPLTAHRPPVAAPTLEAIRH
ncbi:hypothetical protein QEZ40_004742 [Streptomyces katrae]|uniref:Uncharacterized protein n=1 Tax=Streptomyces katrae TaxID=68223 RepID=A0ABT7H0A8_9ACTN|nr:hypothetical protein [Streptomyces katrae]MDK9499322.1 hypothetical protein [Streptomyces katrae]